MKFWFIELFAVIVFYSAIGLVNPLYALMFGEKAKQDGLQKSRLRVSVTLRIIVIGWGLYCLAFVLNAGKELMEQMFRLIPAIALCLAVTDNNTLKWLDSKNQS